MQSRVTLQERMQIVTQRWPARGLAWIAAGAAAMLLVALELRSPSPLKVAAVLAACALPLLAYLAYAAPFVFPYGAYVALMPFDGLLVLGKIGTLTKVLGMASAVALLLWSARKKTVVAMRWPLLIVALLGLWSVASVWWSVDVPATLAVIPTYAGLMLLYGALALVPITFTQYRMLLAAAVCGGIGAALYGGYTFYSDPLLTLQSDGGGRLFSDASHPAIDPNFFADAMLFPFAIVLLCAFNAKSTFLRGFFYCLTAIFLIAIVLSASREAAVAVAVIAAYYALRTRHRLKIAAFAGVGVLFGSLLPNPLWSRFSSMDSPRQSIWSVGLEAFRHRWLDGYGLGNFVEVYDRFYLRVYQVYPNGWSSPAHNVAVHYMVELGVVGLVLILALFFGQFLELRAIEYGSVLYDYRLMCEAGLVGVACSALFIDLFNAKWVWFALAMAAQLRNLPPALRAPPQSAPRNPP